MLLKKENHVHDDDENTSRPRSLDSSPLALASLSNYTRLVRTDMSPFERPLRPRGTAATTRPTPRGPQQPFRWVAEQCDATYGCVASTGTVGRRAAAMRLAVPHLSPALATPSTSRPLWRHAGCALAACAQRTCSTPQRSPLGGGGRGGAGRCLLPPRAEAAVRAGRCLLPPRAEAAVRAGRCLLPPRVTRRPRVEACMQVPTTARAIPIQQRDGLHGGDAAGGGRGRRGHGMRS